MVIHNHFPDLTTFFGKGIMIILSAKSEDSYYWIRCKGYLSIKLGTPKSSTTDCSSFVSRICKNKGLTMNFIFKREVIKEKEGKGREGHDHLQNLQNGRHDVSNFVQLKCGLKTISLIVKHQSVGSILISWHIMQSYMQLAHTWTKSGNVSTFTLLACSKVKSFTQIS